MFQFFQKTSYVLLFIPFTELFIIFILGIGNPILYKSDPKLEYEQLPSQKVKVFHNNISINSLGMKSDELQFPKSANTKRILVYGDSVIFGGNLLSNNSLATNFLKNILKSEKYKYEIANISSGSWGPGNWLAHIKERGIYDADHVLIVLNSNDFFDVPKYESIENNPQYPTKKPLFATIFFIKRYVLPRINTLFKRVTREIQITKNDDQGLTKKNIVKKEEIENSLKDLKEIIKVLREKKVTLSVIQFWDKEEFINNYPRDSNFLMSQVFKRNKIHVLQSGESFKKCSSNPNDLYIDNIHPYKNLAQECLANLMKKSLQTNSMLEIIKK